MSQSKTIILTGASGLLGRAVYQCLKEDSNLKVIGLGFTRLKGDLRKVDLRDQVEVKQLIHETKPDLVIHSAAERRPDVVEKQPDATHQLNVQATQNICNAAAEANSPVLFISTDYVFDGKNPPYKENDATNPLNNYGKSKLDGEKVVLGNKGNMVLRVPLLYGKVEYLDESAVTTLFNKVKDNSKPCKMSHYERRFPTHVEDVSLALKFLVQKRLQDKNISGIFHWSGEEMMTKYDIAMTMAGVCGLPNSHIESDNTPSSGANRPYDAHLASERLEGLGAHFRRLFKDSIKSCLEPFL